MASWSGDRSNCWWSALGGRAVVNAQGAGSPSVRLFGQRIGMPSMWPMKDLTILIAGAG